MMRALGADRVIDYAKEDFSRSGERYDLVLDVASNLSHESCKQALTLGGVHPDRPCALRQSQRLIESGKIKPFIGRTFPLAATAEALRCMQEETVVGRIILTPPR